MDTPDRPTPQSRGLQEAFRLLGEVNQQIDIVNDENKKLRAAVNLLIAALRASHMNPILIGKMLKDIMEVDALPEWVELS